MGAMLLQVLSVVGVTRCDVLFLYFVINLCQGDDIALDWCSVAWQLDSDVALKR